MIELFFLITQKNLIITITESYNEITRNITRCLIAKTLLKKGMRL